MSIRTRRVGHEIRRLISELLADGKVHDPRISGIITITDVDISGDLKSATVYYSCFGDDADRENTALALESAKGFIQSTVGDRLGIKFTPKMDFERDDSIAYGNHIENILDDLEDDISE